uniref:RNA helicase domain-containing protein n=1 Tax=Polynucleobacter sp. TaxID=2029855 RepID=UPI004048ADC4
AHELSPKAYWKPPTTKWWDGYDGESDIIIDDYRRDFCTFADLLRLLDRYPLQVEVKGGTINFNAKRIFITTPKSIENTWEGRTAEDIDQLKRRVTEEVMFGYPDKNYGFAPVYVPSFKPLIQPTDN